MGVSLSVLVWESASVPAVAAVTSGRGIIYPRCSKTVGFRQTNTDFWDLSWHLFKEMSRWLWQKSLAKQNWEIPSGNMAKNVFLCETSYKSTLVTKPELITVALRQNPYCQRTLTSEDKSRPKFASPISFSSAFSWEFQIACSQQLS